MDVIIIHWAGGRTTNHVRADEQRQVVFQPDSTEFVNHGTATNAGSWSTAIKSSRKAHASRHTGAGGRGAQVDIESVPGRNGLERRHYLAGAGAGVAGAEGLQVRQEQVVKGD